MATQVGNTLILDQDDEVSRRLKEVFGITKEELAAVAFAAVAARNDSIPDDPINAPGQLAYIYGTRAVRMTFRPKGWETDRRDNIEATVHPESRVRIIYQNTDTAAQVSPPPKAISGKGAAAERMVDLAEAFLFPDLEKERRAKIKEAESRENETVWFLCVASNESGVWAEISRPRRIENEQFGDFIERIFLVFGENPSSPILLSDQPPQDFEINVSRKK